MPFHVEISSSFHRARAFNLERDELRRAVVEPWLADRRIALGDREWEPRKSGLRILEGPELGTPDLSFGQGWSNAERSSQDVTRQELDDAARAGATVAVLTETESARRTLAAAISELGLRPVDWADVRARALASDSDVAAAVVVVEREDPPQSWLFEAGLVLGALGGRAMVTKLGNHAPPAELREFGLLLLESDGRFERQLLEATASAKRTGTPRGVTSTG